MRRLASLAGDVDALEGGDEIATDHLRDQFDNLLSRIATVDQRAALAAPAQHVVVGDGSLNTSFTGNAQLAACRRRLRMIVELASVLPPGCDEAARILRQALCIELDRIAGLRDAELPTTSLNYLNRGRKP